MMTQSSAGLDIRIKDSSTLTSEEQTELLDMCSAAYKTDFTPFLESFLDPVHVFGWLNGRLVSHALWVTRWLQAGEAPLMRTAFVEAVATLPDFRNRGFASAVLKRLVGEIVDFDIAALSTGAPAFYARLGWQVWRGPLAIRSNGGLLPTPGEHGVMVLPLPKTPVLDLDGPLSAEWREGEPW